MPMENGKLSVVATPIGNLDDMTFRAVSVLQAADYILCEDTRVTGKLLKHYKITTPAKRYDAHASEQTHIRTLIDLQEGKHVAMVSDAGTPGVSDPGVLIVSRARASGIPVEAIPGPSAVTAAFSIAGISGNQFSFLGYIPQKKGRKTFFETLPDYDHPVIFFESTHRIMKALLALKECHPKCRLHVGRELTKMHEEMLVGTPAEVEAVLKAQPERQKGEFVLIVTPEKS